MFAGDQHGTNYEHPIENMVPVWTLAISLYLLHGSDEDCSVRLLATEEVHWMRWIYFLTCWES
jgi:hypothetical protein